MRILVGPTDEAAFSNPTGDYVYPTLEPADYTAVFDFGCGCGRFARQLMQQNRPPDEYRGVDLHSGMIRWCQTNLTPAAPQFTFEHHDVISLSFNPGDKPDALPFSVPDRHFTLVNAHSVFTHLTQPQTEYYLSELRRILRDDGVLRSTWFFFDRADFPMLQDRQAALYTTQPDVTGAVLYDRAWLLERTRALGLTVTHVTAPYIRGFQWEILMRPAAPGVQEVPFPEDSAPRGSQPPIIPEIDPTLVGR
jgi:SAM-dependent methyltransferase